MDIRKIQDTTGIKIAKIQMLFYRTVAVIAMQEDL